MREDLERVIFGSLRLNPALLETTDELTPSLFSGPCERWKFEIIVELNEEGRPEEIEYFKGQK